MKLLIPISILVIAFCLIPNRVQAQYRKSLQGCETFCDQLKNDDDHEESQRGYEACMSHCGSAGNLQFKVGKGNSPFKGPQMPQSGVFEE